MTTEREDKFVEPAEGIRIVRRAENPEPIPLRPGQARRQARFAAREQRKRRN